MPRWMQKKSCYLQYVYLFLSWISFPVWNPSNCFLFWQGTQSHGKAIQFSGLLPVLFCPKWPSISHQDHHYNVCQSMFKIWSCKNRNSVSFFEGSIILHIFWDLEDFSWTDSKLSSFSCNGKDRFPSTGIHKIHSNSYYSHFSFNISRSAFSLFLPQPLSAHFDPLLFNNTTNSVKISKINRIKPYVLFKVITSEGTRKVCISCS